MTILESDIILLASQVMDDVPEGGGAATGNVIVDGVSNNMFPDISELDHTLGRVQLRKVFLGINTPTVDTYLGANFIVMKPPANGDVSAVLFSTGDDFDTRDAAASRIEAYLTTGPVYPGELFGNHIEGQSTVTLQQRTSQVMPNVGDTIELVLLAGDATTVTHSQYVRIIDLSSQVRTFTTVDGSGNPIDFTRNIVSLTIGSTLDHDYAGFDPINIDASINYAGKTKLYTTVVADAAQYYGVVPLTAAASFGDSSVTGDGIFTQLVPSSRTEIAIPDARMNQQLSALIATGTNVSYTENLALTTTSPLYVGGGIAPGSLSLTASGGALTDKGGTLINPSGVVVGAVDYANGICTVSSNFFGGGAVNLTVAYSRAVSTASISNSLGLDVTEATRRLTWVVTLDPNPAPGSLQVSYLAQGHWYVLQDDGSGALRGSDPSFGVGTLNFSTGTVSLTLGALPDSPSEIILAWANGAVPASANLTQIGGSAAASFEIDSGFTNMSVGGLTITWGGHTVTDSSGAPGTLQGYGTGTVNYQTGVIVLSPTTLPAPGTVLTVAAASLADQGAGTIPTLTDAGTTLTGNIGAGPLAGSVQVFIYGTYPLAGADLHDYPTTAGFTLHDDAAGGLNLTITNAAGAAVNAHVGTVDYTTGNIVLNKSTNVTMGQPKYEFGLFNGQWTINYKGRQNRTVAFSIVNGTGGYDAAKYLYNVSTLPGSTMNYTLSAIQLKANLTGYPSFTVTGGYQIQSTTTYGTLASGAAFDLTGNHYLTSSDGTVQKNPVRSTGAGSVAGSWASTGIITVTDWVTGAASTVTNFSAAENPASSVNATTLNTSEVTFRTASAPIASAGFSVRGTMSDGTTFNVTASEDGTISGSPCFGTVNYNTGVITLVFGTSDAGPAGSGIRDASDLGIPGVSFIALKAANMGSLIYDAVAYSYIPLNAEILGLDPVRLPSDGRVPIFKKGNVAVVHYTHPLAAATYSAGTVDMGETRLSRIQIVGADGNTITTGYTVDLDAGHLIISSVAGWSQPAVVSWRIEDMAVVSDAQISGALTFTRPLSHAYPLGSYVSSAFLIGDVHARNSLLFEQSTWTGIWQDTPSGAVPLASYDDINHPVVVTNAAAVTESWALIFTSTTTFEIVGEHLGILGISTTSVDCAPLNPNTGTPYFTLAAAGFGTGWSTGNTIRLDTVGALTPLWLARVVQQGDNLLDDDSFTTLARGDVNT